jgi:hypothetical protein
MYKITITIPIGKVRMLRFTTNQTLMTPRTDATNSSQLIDGRRYAGSSLKHNKKRMNWKKKGPKEGGAIDD